MHWWHTSLGRQSHRELLPSSWVARHLRPQWHHPQPWQLCIWGGHCWICWLRNHLHPCTTMQEIPWRNTQLPHTHKHHRCVLLVWTHKPSVVCLRSNRAHATLSLDFLKSPSSYLFSTRRTKDFSYLIGANFSDPKTGRCALTNQRSPRYPLGTELSNYVQRNVTCG